MKNTFWDKAIQLKRDFETGYNLEDPYYYHVILLNQLDKMVRR